MDISEIKSIILELITETMFGVKLNVKLGSKIYPALISKNTRNGQGMDKEYRLTWFNPKTPIRGFEPIDHISFNKKDLDYILSNQKLPKDLVRWNMMYELPTPQLMFEHTLKNSDIIVGNIDDHGEIIARYGAGKSNSHVNLPGRWRTEGDWRYNALTERVYWHDKHASKDEMLVEEWLNGKGLKVRQHITLSNIFDDGAYQDMWDESHGIYDDEFVTT